MDKTLLKANLKKFYNQEAALRDSKFVRADWKARIRESFHDLIQAEGKKTLLELGPGAGYDSLFFQERGLGVTAVDISGEMVKTCREKGIEAYELDFYELSSLNKKYDCIYALNTLLHVPKADLPHVLREIDSALEAGGLFYLGLYGGEDTETEYVLSGVSDTPRFFAFYSACSLRAIIKNHFQILHFETLSVKTPGNVDTFHSVVLGKKTHI